MGILLGVLTFVLLAVSLIMMLVILAQKSKDAGLGTAFGGGAAESAFGAQTDTVLTRLTIYSAVAFFVLAFLLYLGRIYQRAHANAAAGNALPTMVAPLTPATAPSSAGTVKPMAAPGPNAQPAPMTPAAHVLPAPAGTSTTSAKNPATGAKPAPAPGK